MRTRPLLLLVPVCLAAFVACSDDDAASPASTASATTAAEPVDTTTAPPATAPAGTTPPTEVPPPPSSEPVTDPTVPTSPQPWRRIAPGGDCECADGSEFAFWERPADPTRVVFFLQGGGACFDANTCKFEGGTYTVQANGDPGTFGGLFDMAAAENPVSDRSFVYVPYCTGDVHLGNATVEYAPGLVVQHKGYVNASTALDYLVEHYPDATEILVTGVSAGSIPSPLFAGLLHDRLPDATITVLADGSGAYEASATVTSTGNRWGAEAAIPDWPESAATAGGDWSIPGIFATSARHAPDITWARHDYAYDAVQGLFMSLLGRNDVDLLASADANEALVESSAGVQIASYVAPGTSHTVLLGGSFYTEEVNGVRLVDWVTDLLEAPPVDDVRCEVCDG